MKKILATAAILILGAMLGVGCYLAYQHFQSKESDAIKTLATVKEKEPETTSKHRLDMELAVTDAEKEFFAMINLLETKIGLWFVFNEDKIRKELMRKELFPLIDYYIPIMEKYGISNKLKENVNMKEKAQTKTPRPKKKSSELISGPSRSCSKSIYFKNGRTYDSFVISDAYIYETNDGKTKRVVKSTSYEKVDLNDYFNPEEADWNATELSDEECKYLQSKNVYLCDTTIMNTELKGWYQIKKCTETK